MGVKLDVPFGIAEVEVKLAKRGVYLLITTSESSILKMDFI